MKKQLLLLLLVFPLAIFAQESRTVTGNVISIDDGLPLPGVSIYVDNTTIGLAYGEGVVSNFNIGTISDIDGNFSLEIPEKITKLTFSMIGFDNMVLELTDASVYKIDMKETFSELDEIVVTGYQEI